MKNDEVEIKTLELLSKPLTEDGIACKIFFNTRKKILKYFKANKIRDINIKRKILNLAMGSPEVFYSGVKSSKTMLECDIELYLTYTWCETI